MGRPGPFRSRDFRRFFAAQTISRWGDTFNGVLTDAVGIRAVYVLGASLLLAAGMLGWARLPAPHRLVRGSGWGPAGGVVEHGWLKTADAGSSAGGPWVTSTRATLGAIAKP